MDARVTKTCTYIVNSRSETRLGDSERPSASPMDSSLSLSLVAERWCREPLSLLGVRGPLADDGRKWVSGLVTETTGMGVSRLAMGSALESAMAAVCSVSL